MRPKTISRLQIIEAASKAISSKGIENVSVQDISRQASIAKGSIYLYFKSRDELLIESVRYFASMRVETLRDLLTRHKSPIKKLRSLLKANEAMARKDPELFFMSYSLLLSTHKGIKQRAAREFFEIYLKFVEEIVSEGIKAGEIKTNNPRAIAFTLVFSQDMYNLLQHLDPGGFEVKSYTDELLRLIKS